MKKIISIIAILSISLSINGQISSNKVTDNIVNQLNTLYLSENYKECIDACDYYIGYKYLKYLDTKHPYREWNNLDKQYREYGFQIEDNIETYTTLLYLGSISAYKYSLTCYDSKSIFNGIEWSRACVAIYDDYLSENIPDKNSTSETIYKYISYGERGILVADVGEHLLSTVYDARWAKKLEKWFEKKSDKIYNALYKNLSDKDSIVSDNPILQYKISTIQLSHSLIKGKYKDIQNIYNKRVEALIKLINQSDPNNYNSEIHIALNSLTEIICSTVIDYDFCKKAGKNYERFCMENLIKLKDLSYSLNGSSRYAEYSSYTLSDIQVCLDDNECIIMHFEAPVAPGHLYSATDLGTKYRNYAFLITKNQETPDVWHRGYINDSIVNSLNAIKEEYPNINTFYYIGTPRMAFIDIAGNDSSIVRLHSPSQLLQKRKSETTANGITFIGDINYSKLGDLSYLSVDKGGEWFGTLIGPAKELVQIKALFPGVRSICCDSATRNMVIDVISKSDGIVHISTHGHLFSYDYYIQPEDLILKKNIMDNSRLILSGYNDNPYLYSSYLSGTDVLNIKQTFSTIVFLDACLSGKGAVGASGAVGIAEAFHLIGAQNVICYLEEIDDEIATQFSDKFYLELSKGVSCHDAFFTAKKSIKKNIKVVLWE